MSRQSNDEIRDGAVLNGYDYSLQVWVVGGIVEPCGHPAEMAGDASCCPSARLAGQRVAEIQGRDR